MPHGDCTAQALHIKELSELGVTGYFAEGNGVPGSDMADLRVFLAGRLTFDATLDIDKLLADFLDIYYGGGETTKNIGKYIKLISAAFATANHSIDFTGKMMDPLEARYLGSGPNSSVFGNDTLLAAAVLLTDARKAAVEPHFQHRVDLDMMHLQYVILTRWDSLRLNAKKMKVPWPVHDSKEAEFDSFAAAYNTSGIRSFKETRKYPPRCGGHSPCWTGMQMSLASFRAEMFPALKTDDDVEPATRHTKVTCQSEDCTHVLQSAINTGADIQLQPGLWVVESIYLNNSHQQVKLASGVHVQAKRGAFISPTACLFSIRGMNNVSLVGTGAANSKLSMWKRDYRNASLYKRGEWRCGVDLCGSTSVTVANLTIADTGGDGVYVGASKLASDTFETGCTDILLQGVVTDSAYRNGLSLISGDNVLIQDCQFLRSSGTAPQAGIDIEPNGCKLPTDCEHDLLRNVTFKNVSSKFNNGAGLQFELYGLRLPKARPVSIVVDGMVIVGTANLPAVVKADPLNGTYNIGIDVAAIELGGATGSIIIKDVNVSDCIQPGLEVEDKVPDGTALTLERVSFKNVATGPSIRWGGANVPILVHSAGVFQIGGMTFSDCSVHDGRKRPFFVCDSCRHPNMSAVNVHGNWAVTNRAFPAACSPAWGAAAPVDCKLAVTCNTDAPTHQSRLDK
jgi:hypothetical protein